MLFIIPDVSFDSNMTEILIKIKEVQMKNYQIFHQLPLKKDV
jgi:hypothetical protein